MASLKYWLWLSSKRGLSHRHALKILEHFGTPESAFFADPGEYELLEGVPAPLRALLLEKTTDAADQILADCDRLGQQVLTIQDAAYPERLRQLFDPPIVLYVKGRLPLVDDEVSLAVVGARAATPYGIKMAGEFGQALARGGAVVVSGIAKGVDSAALTGALIGGGPVVSVLGNGIDIIYPQQNRALYEDVAAAGALLSEYPPGTEAASGHFPVRNRLISGLSAGVLVVEGSEISGSLITARHALEQNRDVFAVPGPADAPLSAGPNLLIRRGEAKLVTSARHILEDYEGRFPGKVRDNISPDGAPAALRPIPKAGKAALDEKDIDKGGQVEYIDWKSGAEEFTDDERDILFALAGGVRAADDLIELTQIPARRVLSALTMLQVRGLVAEEPGRRFRGKAVLRIE